MMSSNFYMDLSKCVALLYCMHVICTSTLGQSQFTHFDEDIGYCSHSFHIIQDDYGFLWSGTLTGLVKTDGYQYIKFTNDRSDSSSIATNFSTYLFEDRYSNIWVNGFQYGLSIYDRSEDRFIRIPVDDTRNLQLSYITNFKEVNDSTVYIAGEQGLQRVMLNNEDYTDLSFEYFEIPDSLKIRNFENDHIWHITALPDQNLLLSSVMGFFLFDINREMFFNKDAIEWLPNGTGFSTWLDTVRNQLWFAEAGESLSFLDLNTKKVSIVEGLDIKGGETYMFPRGDSILWVRETGNDLKIIDLETHQFKSYLPGPKSEIGFRDRWSRRFCETVDGSLFIASNDKSRFQHIPSIEKSIEGMQVLDSKNNHTSCVYEDDEFFACSFDSNGFFIRNKKTWVEKHFTAENSDLEDNLIMHLDRLVDGRILVMGKPFAYIYDVSNDRFEILSSAFFFRNGLELSNGDLWLFPGGGASLHCFEKINGKYIRKNSPQALKNIPNVRAAIEVDDGTIWLVSSIDGLYKIDKKFNIINNWRSDINNSNTPIGNSMECLYIDSRNRVWMGSLDGLTVFQEESGTFTNFTQKEGLDDTSISDIIEDENGNVWISSFDGLYRFVEATNTIVRVAKSKTQSQHFSQRGFFKFEDRIYAAGWDGIDVISTNLIVDNRVAPTVQLSNILKNGKAWSTANNLECLEKIDISPQQKGVELQFSAIHYGSSDDKDIQYRVEGDTTWIDMGIRRSIDTDLLSYGEYDIEVRGNNANGIWSAPKKYTLNIMKPWYITTWFYLLCALGIGSILYELYRWRLRQLEIIQKKKIQINKQIAEIELKALKAQMNPHFVFNSLNSVKALILEQQTEDAVTYLTSFSNLIRKILNNSNEKFIRLQDELDTITLYLELEALRFDDAFTYEIKCDSNISTDFVEVPALILQPYIENAIWHGLLPKEEGVKTLDISIIKNEGFIEISITDNGIGRSAAMALKTRSKSRNKSLGMMINSQRIDLLKELYGSDSTIEIIDLVDAKMNAKGTKVILKFYIPD